MLAGNASIRVNERLRQGAESMLKRNPTANELHSEDNLYKNLTSDPSLAYIRHLASQDRNNGAAGVARNGNGPMTKSQS